MKIGEHELGPCVLLLVACSRAAGIKAGFNGKGEEGLFYLAARKSQDCSMNLLARIKKGSCQKQ